MKNLKLEVGKTYLNRQGERVKIVDNNGHALFPFEGDNCLSYTLDGHWDLGRDSAFDLIAEAPPTFRTFKIPENTREISVNETDGRIVIEFVPEVPGLTERERIEKWLKAAGRTDSEAIAEIIETYIKHREAHVCK